MYPFQVLRNLSMENIHNPTIKIKMTCLGMFGFCCANLFKQLLHHALPIGRTRPTLLPYIIQSFHHHRPANDKFSCLRAFQAVARNQCCQGSFRKERHPITCGPKVKPLVKRGWKNCKWFIVFIFSHIGLGVFANI